MKNFLPKNDKKVYNGWHYSAIIPNRNKAVLSHALCRLLLLIVMMVTGAADLFAEGSKDLYPAGAYGGRATLRASTSEATYFPFPTYGTHFVYAKAGETITIASSAQNSNTKRLFLYSPNGTDVTPTGTGGSGNGPNGTRGNISNRTAELAGPRLPGQGTGGNRYIPVYYTVPTGGDGIYKVEFSGTGISDANNSPTDLRATDNWTQGSNTIFIYAWDISVANTAGNGWVEGRVYMNEFTGQIGNTSGRNNSNWRGDAYNFYGKFIVHTRDGFMYEVDNNGNAGYRFTFMVNNKGFHAVGDPTTPSYESIAATTAAQVQSRYHDPRNADGNQTFTHKIFYNMPDNTMPATANGNVPGGSTWLNVSQPQLSVSTVDFVGVDGSSDWAAGNKGGWYIFKGRSGLQYEIKISPSSGANFVEKVLTGTIEDGDVDTDGNVRIYWDGKGGDGVPLPNGINSGSMTLQLRGAEVHFPFIDMEVNPNGLILRQYNAARTGFVSDKVYWNDANIGNGGGTTGGASNPRNASHTVIPDGTSSAGMGGATPNGHKWGSSTGPSNGSTFGNNQGMDTWTFARGTTYDDGFDVTIKEADLAITQLSSDKANDLHTGDEITYTIKVKNNGNPDHNFEVEGALFNFVVPEGFVPSGANPIAFNGNACGTEVSAEELTYNAVTHTFESALNLPKGCEVIYTVKLKVSEDAVLGSDEVKAGILRPDDVYDPDGTNISNPENPLGDLNDPIDMVNKFYPPFDPFVEAQFNGANGVSNNIKSLATKVVAASIQAIPDINQTPINTPVNGNILTNDSGTGNIEITEIGGSSITGGGNVTIPVFKKGSNGTVQAGTVEINPQTGAYTFTPKTDFVGDVEPIAYTIKDGIGNTDVASLNIKVIPNNTPSSNSIIAQDDYATTTVGVGIGNAANPADLGNPSLFNNDSDPQGDSFIVTGVTNGGTPSNGVWSFTVSGTDLDGNPVPDAGTVTIEEEGRYTFVPNASFTGTIDPIEYQICDAVSPIACDEATLNINVIPQTGETDENYTYANDDANSGKMGELQAGNVLGNDTDPEGDNQSVTGFTYMDWDGSLQTATPGSEVNIYVTDPNNAGRTIIAGSLKIDATGYYEYSPDRDFTGTVAVPHSIVDDNTNPATAQATLYLTTVGFNSTDAVEDINNTWINMSASGNVMTNDFDREGDIQVFESFLSQDGNLTPITTGATVSGVDRDGNPVADAGTLTFGSDGTYTFTPSTDFVGTVTVPYRIHDDADNAATDIANLVITVSPNAEDANSVIANNDTYYTLVNIPVAGNNFGNDSDPQDDGFTVTEVTQGGTSIPVGTATTVSGITERGDLVADAGTLTQNADGTMKFVPSQGFAGTVTYTYTITDDHTSGDGVATDQAEVTILVSDNNSGPRNDSDNFPFAGDDFVITATDTPVDGNFIDNDFVPNGKNIFLNGEVIDPETPDNTVIQTLTTVEGGTVEMHQDGTFTYTPATGYNGPDRVVYEVCDFTEVGPFCAQATIYMLVSPNRVLPITLIDFAANRNENVANLTWTTVTESNNAGFDVQRTTDGQSWQSIGHVASKAANGNSNAQLNYRFTDNNPVAGVNYYRLHQQDLDGNSSLSEVRIVNFGDNSDAIVIYPNPVRTTAVVRGLTGNETLRVYDASGRVVRNVKAAGNQTTIDLSGVAQGTYKVQMVSADGRLVKTLSVVKVR